MQQPIVTGRDRVPTWQLVAISWPWAVQVYADMVSGQPLTLTLSKFVSDPLLISFLSSVNILFNFLVGVAACYLSDRIWTRWGRRTPFLVVGWMGAAVCLALIPLMPGLWSLAAAIVAYQFFCDLYKPWEPLYNEVVPSTQRGRSQMFRLLMNGGMGILLSAVMLSRFDSVWELPLGLGTLRGDVALYWLGALLLAATSAGLMLFVREEHPAHTAKSEDRPAVRPAGLRGGLLGGVRQFLVDTFSSAQAWRVYLLYLCPVLALLGGGAGTLWTLFQTRQLGLAAADLARINAVVAPVSLLLYVPLLGLLADRHGGAAVRMTMLRLGLVVPAAVMVGVFALPRVGVPVTVPVLIAAGLVSGLFQTMVWVVWGPLTFDYIPRDRMGTYTAGFTALSGVVGFVLSNLAGGWVYVASRVQSPLSIPTTRPDEAVSDFSSVAILALLSSLVALALTVWFSNEQRKGRVVRAGME